MLIRQTFLYLPAQLLPPIFQFASLIAWSHFATAETIGVVTLFTSIQEFLNLALINFWTTYTVRYAAKLSADAENNHRFRATSTTVLGGSLLIQSILALLLYYLTIDHHASPGVMAVLVLLVCSRAFNLLQSERGRAQGDILLYSLTVMSGPVLGFFIGIGLLWRFGSAPVWVFLGFSLAQLVGSLFGLARDRDWFEIGRPDMALLRHALSYGLPLILSSTFSWVTQNASRLIVSYVSGLAAAGIFSLGFGLGYRASTIASMGVAAAAFPLAVRMSNDGDWEGALRQLSVNGALLFGVLCASLIGLALVAKDVLHLMVSSSMRDAAYPVMMWCLLAGGFLAMRTTFLNQVLLLKAETRPIAILGACEAVTMVGAAAVAVPMAGAAGGAAAFAGITGVAMLVMIRLATAAGLVMPWRDYARVALASGAMAAAVLATPHAHTIPMLLARIAAGGAAFVAVLAILYGSYTTQVLRLRRSPRTV